MKWDKFVISILAAMSGANVIGDLKGYFGDESTFCHEIFKLSGSLSGIQFIILVAIVIFFKQNKRK